MSPEVTDAFSKFESKKSYTTTKTFDATKMLGPHLIKLPAGAVPDYIELTNYQKFCWRTMGKLVGNKAKNNQKLELQLLQAHMRIRPEEYMSFVVMTTVLVLLGSIAAAVLFGGVAIAILHLQAALVLLFLVVIVIMPAMLTYMLLLSSPGSKAKARMRNINRKIGPAMSFISAMSSADVNIDVIFKELAKQDIYGEIKNEAEWITRDTELLGIDILTAIKLGAQRSPSTKFQEFLQGVVTTATSGGQLKPYFLQKAEQFEKEGKLEMRSTMETLGLMAESFVTVVVAFPLFLVVIMAIMAVVQGGAMTVTLLWAVVIGMIPLSQFGFTFFIWNMTKEMQS